MITITAESIDKFLQNTEGTPNRPIEISADKLGYVFRELKALRALAKAACDMRDHLYGDLATVMPVTAFDKVRAEWQKP
jgi:hypothetical protein